MSEQDETTTATAAYAVEASAVAEAQIPGGMDPDAVAAYLADEVPADVSLCHECGHRLSNVEVVALTSFTLDGVDYEQDPETRHWVQGRGR